ncbi:hypothetical protein UK23_20835 [Lentzea aerocolonigenes]|uniref:Uncharacterized protein n=1 Tax=Lentzea aerocolonigenes TaxID=68170 RepID=A0A0F0H0Z1_LENAE|nr:hypothetical protein UK23_20835 [Lentzea aerocolonigenes]
MATRQTEHMCFRQRGPQALQAPESVCSWRVSRVRQAEVRLVVAWGVLADSSWLRIANTRSCSTLAST